MKNVYFQVKRGKPKRVITLELSSERRKCTPEMPHPKSGVYIINSKGEREVFSFQKVYRSALRAGADKNLAREIAGIIQMDVYSGMRTFDIYKRVRGLLARKNSNAGLRFSLKQAIRKLGPTGFPFEKYAGVLFKGLGYDLKLNQLLPGKCVRGYEIDFLAVKDNTIYIGECKYRNLQSNRIHTNVVLANQARFLDILNGALLRQGKYKNYNKKTIIVTNTKFTGRAKQYARCVDTKLLGWKEPRNNSLENIIEKQKFYPITILPSLKSRARDAFVSQKMMLARDVLRINPQRFSKKFRIPLKNLEPLIKEAKILLGK
jgi:hypothetical protein